ncbi:MAG: YceI family protein [Sphingobacteriales bacterium]|nr:YceI family protein [Sphingobacteriales bacterium]
MKKTTLFLALVFLAGSVFAQRKTTTTAAVSFDASTVKDALPKADNKTVIGSIDTQTGAVAFEAAVNNFSFSNPKMQEHFNGANWMNSAQFPKFTFAGQIQKPGKIKYNKNGSYTVDVTGDLTIKDISQKITVSATFTVTDGKVKVSSAFSIKLADYNITGQPVEAGKVDKEPKVTVSAEF